MERRTVHRALFAAEVDLTPRPVRLGRCGMTEGPADIYEPHPRDVSTENGQDAAIRGPRHFAARISVADAVQVPENAAVGPLQADRVARAIELRYFLTDRKHLPVRRTKTPYDSVAEAENRASCRSNCPCRKDRDAEHAPHRRGDRKSTRLNSSHGSISYAVFCL